MNLLLALGISQEEGIDPTRPLAIGDECLGVEAAAEAKRIVDGGEFSDEVRIEEHNFDRATYWAVHHEVEGDGEIFGFPSGTMDARPTALEVGIVRALAAAPVDHHQAIMNGSRCISVGPDRALEGFRKIVRIAKYPLVGESILVGPTSQATISPRIRTDLSQTVLDCLENSFKTSPLKFRFLELYRMMEARFLADVKSKLFANFDSEPSVALSDAVDALKSEMNQIAGLAAAFPQPFEACWGGVSALKGENNRFATSLFRRIDKKGQGAGGKAKAGAALIYQMRCAIVHAGEKDMIFEQYPDGEHVIESIIADVERAALVLAGVELA